MMIHPHGSGSASPPGPASEAVASADAHLARAFALATANARDGGGPFGALVVTADGRAFEGVNRVTAINDPTAHAEVTAIRAACAELDTFDLAGAALYTSCEPCPMCLGAALWARVDRIVFAADRHDAAEAGFDDAAFSAYFEGTEHRDAMPVAQLVTAHALAPFEAWGANAARTE